VDSTSSSSVPLGGMKSDPPAGSLVAVLDTGLLLSWVVLPGGIGRTAVAEAR
jgi:hypothetical protein